MTQFVKCRFPGTARLYTYRWEGEAPLEVGQDVIVDTKHGWTRVVVAMVDVPEPTEFEAKAILRRADAEPSEEAVG